MTMETYSYPFICNFYEDVWAIPATDDGKPACWYCEKEIDPSTKDAETTMVKCPHCGEDSYVWVKPREQAPTA